MTLLARREINGSLVGVGSACALGAVMIPLRSHVSIATVGLVLVVPVVAGVVVGGLVAGAAAVAAGFLVYDFVFIPPYYTLSVGAAQNWVALGVYVVVMLLVSRVVERLQAARAVAVRRDAEARRLLELSDLLVTDRPIGDLLQGVVDTVLSVSSRQAVALLLPRDGTLTVAAASGRPIPAEEIATLMPASGAVVSVRSAPPGTTSLHTMALSAAGRPVGILAMRGTSSGRGTSDEVLQVFANQAALAIERAQLRDQALRSEALEEADSLRRALLAVVSHDLRTPLSTMKVASSALLDETETLSTDSRRELYELLDSQTDRLSRLVSGLLDMSRYQAGALRLQLQPTTVTELVGDAIIGFGAARNDRKIRVRLAGDLPGVCVDRILMGEVIVNLIDNADRHSPAGAPIFVTGGRAGAPAAGAGGSQMVEIEVADSGPGVPPADREIIFESFQRSDTGGRAGLGLWICKTFIEAHGGTIRVADPRGPDDGARFVFTLPAGDGPEGG